VRHFKKTAYHGQHDEAFGHTISNIIFIQLHRNV
jgi:hypothetical protein